MSEREQQPLHLQHPRCPFCHDAVQPGATEKVACQACMAWHHGPCWAEHGGCAACGEGRPAATPGPQTQPTSKATATPAGAPSATCTWEGCSETRDEGRLCGAHRRRVRLIQAGLVTSSVLLLIAAGGIVVLGIYRGDFPLPTLALVPIAISELLISFDVGHRPWRWTKKIAAPDL